MPEQLNPDSAASPSRERAGAAAGVGAGPGAGAGAKTTTASARDTAIQALGLVERGERNALERLREALCGFVGALRGEGVSRDEVIEIVRTLVATPTTPDATFALLGPAREALVELSVHWCAEEYERTVSTKGEARSA